MLIPEVASAPVVVVQTKSTTAEISYVFYYQRYTIASSVSKIVREFCLVWENVNVEFGAGWMTTRNTLYQQPVCHLPSCPYLGQTAD